MMKNTGERKNILRDTTALAKAICQEYIYEGMTAVDATCGNGHDTLWLAERCGKVYAFDIQPEAVANTCRLLEEKGFSNAEVICDSHSNMDRYIEEKPGLFMFNLGYLPGGDKEVTTSAGTTISALELACAMTEPGGLICVIIYWGHPQGKEERHAVLDWASGLDKSRYHCVRTDMVNQPGCPPEILFITRKN